MRDRGIRAEQDPLDPAEHRGIGTDAESEAQNCECGKARAAEQLPEAIAQILIKVRKDSPAASVAALLLDLRDSA